MSTIRDGQLRLTLVSHAATAAMRRGQMPDDDLPDQRGLDDARGWPGRDDLPAGAKVFTSPAPCAIATAQALGLQGEICPALAEMDLGRWRGQRLNALAQDEPEALQAWLSDPDMDAHGGESFSALLRRVGAWMDALAGGEVVAVTHAPVMRAALLHALAAPPSSFRHVEIAPLSVLRLAHGPRGWTWSPAPQPSAASSSP